MLLCVNVLLVCVYIGKVVENAPNVEKLVIV